MNHYQQAEQAGQRGDKAVHEREMKTIYQERGRYNPAAPIAFSAKHIIGDALLFVSGAAIIAFVAVMVAVTLGVL